MSKTLACGSIVCSRHRVVTIASAVVRLLAALTLVVDACLWCGDGRIDAADLCLLILVGVASAGFGRGEHAAGHVLTETHRQLLMAEEIAGVGHWRLSLPTRIVTWSDEVFRIHGLDRDNGVPELAAAIAAYHPADRPAVTGHVERAIRDGREFRAILRLVRPDGEIRLVRSHGVPERDRRGKIVAVFGVFIDITDGRRIDHMQARLHAAEVQARLQTEASNARLQLLARTLAAERDRAEQASRAKSQFLAGVSHELRTPLNAIIGYAQLIKQDGGQPAGQPARVDAMLGAGFQLLGLINRILDVSDATALPALLDCVASEPACPTGVAQAPPLPPLRVLIVDDVAMNRDIAGAFLRHAGHHVDCVDGGVQGVDRASGADYDVILMDVRMPDLDGLEATRRIRALPGERGRVPIVALTAQAFREQISACRLAGMNAHLAKPFTSESLDEALARAVAPVGKPWGPGPNPAGRGTPGPADTAIR